MKYYSTQETAEKLNYTRQRINQLCKEGKIAYEAVGKVKIISDTSIKSYKIQYPRKGK